MTKLLEQAIAKLRALLSERQDEAAELLLNLLEQDAASVQLSDAQAAEVERCLREPAAYASHAEVRSFFHKHSA